MNKKQLILIGGAVLLFCFIYFGMSTIPKNMKDLEMSRSANIESTGIQNLVMDAKKGLSDDKHNIIQAMQAEFKSAEDNTEKVDKAKRLASKWYEYGYPIISGYFAEEVATIENTKDAWSIAGTTYSIGMKGSDKEKEIAFAKKRAIGAFEKAISLAEDENIDDRINLALIYVNNPDTNPMQGIQMLMGLNEKYPESVLVLNQLARLAILTGQIDKAIARLEKALSIEPENNNSICLIADAYLKDGQSTKAKEFFDICKK